MPNDVPDWTGQQRVNIRGEVSGAPLGDVGAAALDKDTATESVSVTGGQSVNAMVAALASFKPAAGATIALVKAGPINLTNNLSSISPAFGQATTAGNFLIAWVKSVGTDPASVSVGWSKVVSRQNATSGEWVAIWKRESAGAAEAAPTFTLPGGSFFRGAQVAEFSGVLAAAATDQSASATTATSPISVTTPSVDSGFGDLLVWAVATQLTFNGFVTFADTLNNSAAPVSVGNTLGQQLQVHVNFVYGIVPAATTVLPLGVSDWPHDVSATSAPAVGVQATVTLAATPGKRWVTAHLGAGTTASTATATNTDVILKDGVTAIWTEMLSSQAAIGSQDKINLRGLGYRGTIGNAMTFGFTAAQGSQFQRVNVGAYLR